MSACLTLHFARYGFKLLSLRSLVLITCIPITSDILESRNNKLKYRFLNDYKQYIKDAACRAASAEQAGDTATLFRIVRDLSPKKPKLLNMCKLEDGSNAATPLQNAERWERFFASNTGGLIQHKDVLFNNYVISCNAKKQQAEPTHL